jgi:hypothetical protein
VSYFEVDQVLHKALNLDMVTTRVGLGLCDHLPHEIDASHCKPLLRQWDCFTPTS